MLRIRKSGIFKSRFTLRGLIATNIWSDVNVALTAISVIILQLTMTIIKGLISDKSVFDTLLVLPNAKCDQPAVKLIPPYSYKSVFDMLLVLLKVFNPQLTWRKIEDLSETRFCFICTVIPPEFFSVWYFDHIQI